MTFHSGQVFGLKQDHLWEMTQTLAKTGSPLVAVACKD